MATPLFDHIVNNTRHQKATYEQFCLDAKRMLLVVDDKKEDSDIPVQCIYAWIINLFANEKIGFWFAYWCTQTALASIYETKVLDINHRFNITKTTATPSNGFVYHLIDDGRQHVYICLSHLSNDHADMYIYKPFRVCYYSDYQQAMCTLFYYHLRVHISTHHLGQYHVKWIQYDTHVPMHIHNEHLTTSHLVDDTWVVLH